MNVTVTGPTAPVGYLSVYPGGAVRPPTSNLNFVAGLTLPNLVQVKLGAGGAATIYNGSTGTVNVVVDLAGYFTA